MKEENQGIESQVINLGFVQSIATKLSANELAANGIQLSIRENIIKFIQGMDKDTITQKEQKLLKVLQNSQDAEQVAEDAKPVSTEQDQIQTEHAHKISSNGGTTLVRSNPSSKRVDSLLSREIEEDDETNGLLFYDPQKEERARKEKEFLEQQRNLSNLLKDSNQNTSNAAIQAANNALLNKGLGNQRQNFLTSLKHLKNKKNAMTLDKIKSTFQATELIPESKSKQNKIVDADGLIVDRESDSEFDPEKDYEQQVAPHVWDDEENVVNENHGDEDGEAEVEEDDESMSQSQVTEAHGEAK